ncbi:MAG: MBL fold metallo-hydrolase [Patescibacteria group bacterium]|nr:MBL fold metallo-hydrolase [Patescibacteria group bacterium]
MEISYLGSFEYLLKHKGVKVLISLRETKIESDSEPIIINGPGEYEVKGVLIAGFKGDEKNTIYTYDLDGIRVAFLGEVKQKLTTKQLDWLDGVDVLLVSAEGADLVKQIGPSWAVSSEPIKGLEGTPRREKKLTVNKLSLPEETELVIL